MSELPGRLHIEGTELVKPNGKKVVLRGVNLGAVDADTPADPVEIAGLGANCVRVALRWWKDGDPAVDARDNDGFAFFGRAAFEHWIAKCQAASDAGLWVIPFIDSDCGQSGTQSVAQMQFCDPYQTWGADGRNFYTDLAMRRVFATVVWPAAAARLRQIERVAMLELHPEPAGDRGSEYAPIVREVYQDIMAAVRQVDQDTPFLVGARGGYAIKFCDEAWLADRDDCVYTGNLLDPWVSDEAKFDEGLAYLTAMRDARGVPIFGQQVGRKSINDRDLSKMRYALERLADERVGYTWWTWKQWREADDSYGLNYSDGEGGWVSKDDEKQVLAEQWA